MKAQQHPNPREVSSSGGSLSSTGRKNERQPRRMGIPKRALPTIMFILILFSLEAQNTDNRPIPIADKKELKREFKNQGEQEDYWAEQLFEKAYSKQYFRKFQGHIGIRGNLFTNGNTLFEVINTSQALFRIFSSGLFYPSIIDGDNYPTLNSNQEPDSSSTEQRDLNLISMDSLTISGFEELKILRNSPKYKRFRFWLFRKGLANPTVCFIELTNDNAIDQTDLKTFIDGATLTFFKEGWFVM